MAKRRRLDPKAVKLFAEIIANGGVLACSREAHDALQASAQEHGYSLEHVQWRIDSHLKKGSMFAVGADLVGLVASQPAHALTTSEPHRSANA